MLRYGSALGNRIGDTLTGNHQFFKNATVGTYLASDVGPLYATAVDVSFYFWFPFRLEVNGQFYIRYQSM
jgi:hypothetical protein